MLDKENRQVLDKVVEAKYCFSELHGKPDWRFPWAARNQSFGVKDGGWLGSGAASH
jgi:hypothetical protein